MPTREEALEQSRNLALTPANLDRLARTVGPDLARWALGQWELRKRAQAKFSRAAEMWFVREALEQATHEEIAAYHASRFADGAPVLDLTCGIGGDVVALAARGPALGCELDPDRAEAARHNLSVHERSAEVRVVDGVAELESGRWPYAIADPARRAEGRRLTHLGDFAPDPRRISELFAKCRLGIMKLTPMLSDAELESLGSRLEFLSFGGECREALVFAGEEATPGRQAVHLESGERIDAGPDATGNPTADTFIFDADPALVRAHGVGTLANALGLRVLGESRGYLTGPEPVASPWLRAYRVRYDGKGDPKSTRAQLRELGANTPILKQRGAGLDLDKERRHYPPAGTLPVVLLCWTLGKRLRHTIAEPI